LGSETFGPGSNTGSAISTQDLSGTYSLTALYSILGPSGNQGSTGANLSVNISGVAPPPIPLPASLPLFASGLGALGLLGWHRKRKSTASVLA